MPSDTKITEEIDLSHDPQTTERNLGGALDSPNNQQKQGGYLGLRSDMAGDDGDTERRFNSNVYQSQKHGTSTDVPLKVKQDSPHEMLETSNRPLNMMNNAVGSGVLDDYGDEEEEKKERAGGSSTGAAYVSQNSFIFHRIVHRLNIHV